MLVVRVSAEPVISQWSSSFNATEQQLKMAAQRALNKTARWMRGQIASNVAESLQINRNLVSATLVILRAQRTNLEAGLALPRTAGVIKVKDLGGVSETTRGVRAGRRHFDHAFLSQMPNGHHGVFRRRGKTRLPIQEVQLVATGRIARAMEMLADGAAMEKFQQLFERELSYLLKQT